MSAVGSIMFVVPRDLRECYWRLAIYGASLLIILFSGCDQPTNSPQLDHAQLKGNSTMETPALKQQVERPPIDHSVSSTIATATFALG